MIHAFQLQSETHVDHSRVLYGSHDTFCGFEINFVSLIAVSEIKECGGSMAICWSIASEVLKETAPENVKNECLGEVK